MTSNFKNVLITGGAGFIGSNFVSYYIKKYSKTNIIVLDLLTYSGNLKNLDDCIDDPRLIFVEGDINDYQLVSKLFEKYEIDGVINFAAESHVDNSIVSPEIFIKTNINGVFNLLNICFKNWMNHPFEVKKKFKHSRFHQISTDEVFGSIDKGSFTENSNYSPNSPYSASKASADMLVRSFNKTYGLNTSISISSNNYGRNQHIEKFIPKVINALLNKKYIPVYGDGTNIRDWISVDDNINAIDLIFNESKSGSVYNIGGDNEISNIDVINIIHKIISKHMPSKKLINFINDRFGHDKRYSLNSEKIKNDLDWRTKSLFEEKIEIMIKNKIK